MRYIDVFNGDADGICALRQLRLDDPVASELVTGVKRDIALLDRVHAGEGDRVTVLDISLDRNRAGLARLLAAGAAVRYFDHHHAGELPSAPGFRAVIDEGSGTCTSALVDRTLGGRFRPWAVVGAFGDGLEELAVRLAEPLRAGPRVLDALRDLGATINYNSYGESLADVLVPPAELYRIVSRYADPFDMLRAEPLLARLSRERRADLQRALRTRPLCSLAHYDAYVLPDAAWSRRVNGTFANRLARRDPGRAHAVLTPLNGGDYAVSVRAPSGCGGAGEFCRGFPGGGGRRSAGGIDHLRPERVGAFLDVFGSARWSEPARPRPCA